VGTRLQCTAGKGLEKENELVTQILRTEDFTEGITAYLEKRKPEYKGRQVTR
jgi:enoyl-CoA hydratase/carnithine racemase